MADDLLVLLVPARPSPRSGWSSAPARCLAVVFVVGALLLAGGGPVAADAPGYGGTAGTLSARTRTGAGGEREVVAEVSGFLAGSTVSFRLGDGAAVRVPASDAGAARAVLPLDAAAGTGERPWVSASGVDPSFQARLVSARAAGAGAGGSLGAGTVLLGVVVLGAAALATAPIRRRARTMRVPSTTGALA